METILFKFTESTAINYRCLVTYGDTENHFTSDAVAKDVPTAIKECFDGVSATMNYWTNNGEDDNNDNMDGVMDPGDESASPPPPQPTTEDSDFLSLKNRLKQERERQEEAGKSKKH
jgi:hypothetical protein